jgi:hypothetical protein
MEEKIAVPGSCWGGAVRRGQAGGARVGVESRRTPGSPSERWVAAWTLRPMHALVLTMARRRKKSPRRGQ